MITTLMEYTIVYLLVLMVGSLVWRLRWTVLFPVALVGCCLALLMQGLDGKRRVS